MTYRNATKGEASHDHGLTCTRNLVKDAHMAITACGLGAVVKHP